MQKCVKLRIFANVNSQPNKFTECLKIGVRRQRALRRYGNSRVCDIYYLYGLGRIGYIHRYSSLSARREGRICGQSGFSFRCFLSLNLYTDGNSKKWFGLRSFVYKIFQVFQLWKILYHYRRL